MKYLNFFDDVYYVNLDEDTYRKEKFEEKANKFDINAIRFSGIHPSIEDCKKMVFWTHWYDLGVEMGNGKVITNRVGCGLSHLSIIKIAEEKKLENVLIFEDDCLFLEDFKKNLQNCVNDIVSNNIEWDILYLGGEPNTFCNKISDNLSVINGGVYCCHAYAVNKSFYSTMLQLYESFKENEKKVFDIHINLDEFLVQMTNSKNVTCILSKKILAIQEDGYSHTIDSNLAESSHRLIKIWNDRVTNSNKFIFNQLKGITTLEIINLLIKKYNFKSYLEINNKTNEMLQCNLPIKTTINQKLSDEFFKKLDTNFDIIFIDGYHDLEQDFRNITDSLKHLNEGGIIIIHDCNSYVESFTVNNDGGTWLGDSYKAYIDAVYTYDLDHFTVDSDWGCGIIMSRKNINFDVERKKIVPNWDFFDKNRKVLLNLISSNEFKDKILKNGRI